MRAEPQTNALGQTHKDERHSAEVNFSHGFLLIRHHHYYSSHQFQ